MGLIRRVLGRHRASEPVEPVEDPPFVYEPDPSWPSTGRVRNEVYAKTRSGKVWHRIVRIDRRFMEDPNPWLAGHGRSFGFACGDGASDHHPTGGTTADPRFEPTPIRTDVPPRSETCRTCLREIAKLEHGPSRR